MRSVYSPPNDVISPPAYPLGADLISTGNETLPRLLASSFAGGFMGGSGIIMLSTFMAYRTELANFVACQTGSNGAGATPTVCRMGLYRINNATNAATYDYTLLASTANDTTLFANAYSGYKRALTTPYTLVEGTLYAFGIIVVSAFVMPAIVSSTYGLNDTYGSAGTLVPNNAPPVVQRSTVQADLVDVPHANINAAQAGAGKAWAWFSAT